MSSRRHDQPIGHEAPQRIAKLLARAGIASRREVERMIADGRVAIDGVAIATPATLLASLEAVTVDGRPVAAPEPARLFLYHKPVGLLVTERDPRGRPTIYDRLPGDLPRVVPVGRLDLATEGLLLLTTDGALKRALELPANGVERTYRARAYGTVSQPMLETLIEGITIDGVRYGSIDANIERRTGANLWIELTLTEGKNREVRRVLEHLGLQVSRLIRTRYGPFVLADLPAGGIGEVRSHDLDTFRATIRPGRRRARGEPQEVYAVPRLTPAPLPGDVSHGDRYRPKNSAAAGPGRSAAGREHGERTGRDDLRTVGNHQRAPHRKGQAADQHRSTAAPGSDPVRRPDDRSGGPRRTPAVGAARRMEDGERLEDLRGAAANCRVGGKPKANHGAPSRPGRPDERSSRANGPRPSNGARRQAGGMASDDRLQDRGGKPGGLRKPRQKGADASVRDKTRSDGANPATGGRRPGRTHSPAGPRSPAPSSRSRPTTPATDPTRRPPGRPKRR